MDWVDVNIWGVVKGVKSEPFLNDYQKLFLNKRNVFLAHYILHCKVPSSFLRVKIFIQIMSDMFINTIF